MLVPEINLTPQLEERVRARFTHLGEAAIVSMHSGMTPAQRLNSWLSAHTGQARLVLGTRLAVLASIPHLKLIVVDEEHDPSYKQQEGARYSARDLAVYRGQLEGAQVILGSATPSLESWHHSREPVAGEAAPRYVRLSMPSRIGSGQLPVLRRVDMGKQPRKTLVSAPLLEAMRERIAKREQVLVLLNRRGYAPVLHCQACGWKSECPHCSAYRVFHKSDRSLRCHHCSLTQPVPRACPACGNQDIGALGHGTERIEEHLAELLHDMHRPDGMPLRIARIDADSTRGKGELVRQLAEVHDGDVDVLVGTQMVVKGLDFEHVALVGILDADGLLAFTDFRVNERAFQLMEQVSGRAGRRGEKGSVVIQTSKPGHPIIMDVINHDYKSFYTKEIDSRKLFHYPPYTRLIQLFFRHTDKNKAFEAANFFASRTLPLFGDYLIGPAEPGVNRIRNKYIYEVMLKLPREGAKNTLARQHIQQVMAMMQADTVLRSTHILINVDPQ
jgi:primosomal protein N' (replication factor Y)